MGPLKISPETAITLSKQLGVPLEHLMHMPQHILLQKIAELSKNSGTGTSGGESGTSGSGQEEQ
ncbi:YycC family protein [Paenibacillus tepidiphilus]|uniref:YycC family protein n=1 Tax=Paenibacillus tepidiphilus TaxID=2608683 RepID=UPI0012389D27|nr:YycC family protein [Paenibacillus tepidiphilus]